MTVADAMGDRFDSQALPHMRQGLSRRVDRRASSVPRAKKNNVNLVSLSSACGHLQ